MTEFVNLLIPFLLVHTVCDFYLQPLKWIKAKKQNTWRAPELYYHALLHGVALIIPAMMLNLDWTSTASLVVIVAVTHFFIDLWKVSTPKGDSFSYFMLDQVLHIAVLVGIALHMSDGITLTGILKHEQFSKYLLVAFAYLLILKPTSIVIGIVLNKYPITQTSDDEDFKGLIAGGELIGYLERTLILTFTLVGSYAAVGFVLAAKSIFRFGELTKTNNRSMTEYVLIGSLVSVVITTLLGTLVSLDWM